jgi:hypothetical protein
MADLFHSTIGKMICLSVVILLTSAYVALYFSRFPVRYTKNGHAHDPRTIGIAKVRFCRHCWQSFLWTPAARIEGFIVLRGSECSGFYFNCYAKPIYDFKMKSWKTTPEAVSISREIYQW